MIPREMETRQPHTAATVAIISAVVSWMLSFSGHPLWAIVLALAAVLFGMGGLVMAASPRVSGGIISIVSIVLGAIGVILGFVALIGRLAF